MVQIFRGFVSMFLGTLTTASLTRKLKSSSGVRVMSSSERTLSENVTKQLHKEAKDILAEMPKRFV